jgi:hypothetical protein
VSAIRLTERSTVRFKTGSVTKKARVEQAVLSLLLDHDRNGELPTTGRFVFYELEQRGEATKPDPNDKRRNRRRSIGWPPGAQDVTDALTRLRERGVVPWSWIFDEERQLVEWSYAATVADYMRDRLAEARINPWGEGLPPLVLCESKATAGVLRSLVSRYVCPIAGTKGQTRGFLHTEVAPILTGNDRRVLYLGDLDRSGADIEANTRRVLEREAGRVIDWTRLGMTEEQAAEHGIDPIWKMDGRDDKEHWAVEVESLGQAAVVALVRDALDALLPEPLADVLERERRQRAEVGGRLEGA